MWSALADPNWRGCEGGFPHVGAGTGYYSAILAEIVGRSGRVTAIEIDPACAPHAMFALSTKPRIASSVPVPSPRSALRFTANPLAVLGIALEQGQGVTDDRQDGLERFRGALRASR